MPSPNKPHLSSLLELNPPDEATLRQGGGFLAGMRDLRAGFKARNFLVSLSYAWEGLAYVARTQRNFRIHLALACLALAMAIFFQVSVMEWAVLWVVIGIVLFAELMNTVVELFVDMVTEGRYDLRAKAIKDMAAGAVFVTAFSALACGVSIFLPHMVERYGALLGL